MDPNLQTALLLMLVGMLTVFSVLALIVGMGRALIRIVNHFSGDKQPGRTGVAAPRPSELSGPTLAALVAAVSISTKGQGRIERIEKLP